MKNLENIQRLIDKADKLIRLEATGTPDEFAVRLGISRASLFRLLEELKNGVMDKSNANFFTFCSSGQK